MPANPYIAEALLRASSPTFELGLDIRREEEEERRQWLERARAVERRERKFGKARGLGRIAGSILGFLLGGPPGAAIGSYAGQRGAVALSPGAMKTFKRIGPGVYFVEAGRERERRFERGERDWNRYTNEAYLASALTDALTGYSAANYGPTAKYSGSLLDWIMGGTRSTGSGLFGRWTPRAGEF